MAVPPVQKDQVVELRIEALAYGGMGLARLDGYVVFVSDALPGDRVRARIRKRKANHAQATVEELIEPSPVRIPADCPLHGHCGGCVWQTLPYDEQLKVKERHVAEALEHIGGQAGLPLEPIAPSPRVWRYRNKMEFAFGAEADGGLILGFHLPGRFDRIFSVGACLIQPEPFDAALRAVEAWARRSGLAPYDPRSHRGILRNLALRRSETDGRWLAILVTQTTEVGGRLEELAGVLGAADAGFRGLLWGFNDAVADVVRIEREAGRVGDLWLEEQIEDLRFRISPFSFFQTNTLGAAALYRVAREFLDLSGRETVLDAYCGAGTIGIFCAGQAQRVFGVEIVTEAVWDARENASRNGLGNCVFIAAPLAQGLRLAQEAAGRDINRVVIDPPRGGMDKRSLKGLLGLRAPVFVYISCNPATLSRDVAAICEAGYRIARVKPIDLFPHTYHIETVIRFDRVD